MNVTTTEATLSELLNEVLLDRLITFGVKLTILFFFVAFTVAVIRNIYGKHHFPPALRNYVYGTYVALMIGAALSLLSGDPMPRASAQAAAREITNVLRDSGRASEQRSENVVPNAAPLPAPAATPGGRVVYIQTPNLAARNAAEAVRMALNAAGYMAPGIEIIDPAFTPGTAEVRYFNAADRQFALGVAEIAGANGLTVPLDKVKEQSGYKAPLGQIELWYPRPPDTR